MKGKTDGSAICYWKWEYTFPTIWSEGTEFGALDTGAARSDDYIRSAYNILMLIFIIIEYGCVYVGVYIY